MASNNNNRISAIIPCIPTTSLVALTIALTLTTGLSAQVTIGSTQPPAAGALLDLKQEGTTTKGLGLPRVALQSDSGDLGKSLDASVTTTGTLDKDAHKGLLVYNTNPIETADRLCPGLHVWTGDKWQPLIAYPDWSAESPTAGTPVVEVTRTPLNDPLRPVGHMGYEEDIRGPLGNGEYNHYAYARFYSDKIKTKTTTPYTGQNPLACIAKITTWTEITEVETIDDGIFMTQNINTRYFPDGTLINGGVPSATAVITDAQFAYPSSTGAITKTDYWDKSQGVLYNYKAAMNKDIGDVDEENTAHEIRQGICPTGWHVPSDMELTALTGALGGLPVAGAKLKSLTRLAGSTNAITNASSASADMGGFDLLLAGYAYSGSTNIYGNVVYLWSSSSNNSNNAWDRTVNSGNANVGRNATIRSSLFSVRCKQDN